MQVCKRNVREIFNNKKIKKQNNAVSMPWKDHLEHRFSSKLRKNFHKQNQMKMDSMQRGSNNFSRVHEDGNNLNFLSQDFRRKNLKIKMKFDSHD